MADDGIQWEPLPPAAEMRRWLEEQIEQCHRLGMHVRAGAFLDCLAHMEWIPDAITWSAAPKQLEE